MSAEQEAARRQIAEAVYERLDPDGYGWAAGDHPSIDDVVDSTLDAALPVLLDGIDRDELARLATAEHLDIVHDEATRADIADAGYATADAMKAHLRAVWGEQA